MRVSNLIFASQVHHFMLWCLWMPLEASGIQFAEWWQRGTGVWHHHLTLDLFDVNLVQLCHQFLLKSSKLVSVLLCGAKSLWPASKQNTARPRYWEFYGIPYSKLDQYITSSSGTNKYSDLKNTINIIIYYKKYVKVFFTLFYIMLFHFISLYYIVL